MPAKRLARKQPEIGLAALTWERWRLAGVFRGEAFPPSTRRRDGGAPRITTESSDGSLILC